jgi:hypothetical protein
MKPNQLVISYVPLLTPASLPAGPESLGLALRNSPDGKALGCAWLRSDDGEMSPVLIYDRARPIVSHLQQWAENVPSEWFQLHFTKRVGDYSLALIPNLQRAKDRMDANMILQTGMPLGSAQVIFIPLHFISHGTKLDVNLDHPEVTIYLLDSRHVNPQSFDPSCLDKKIQLGKFPVVHDSEIVSRYMSEGYGSEILN